jgi:8-oxo-dGTP pyrophosphatase MutT (NUDIX family)
MAYQENKLAVSCKGIVFEDGQVWLRFNNRGEWEIPGGKLDPGEQPEETVAREIQEELGLKVRVKDLVSNYLYTVQLPVEGREVFVTIYLCELVERVGDQETTDWDGTEIKFQRFAVPELDELPMPDFYKDAIRRAAKL